MGDVVVTESARRILDGTPGISEFRPVIKAKIVRQDWSRWNVGDDEAFDDYGEPEHCLLLGQHDEELAAEMGELFEAVLTIDGGIEEKYDREGQVTANFTSLPKAGFDFFKCNTPGGMETVVATAEWANRLSPDVTKWLYLNPIDK